MYNRTYNNDYSAVRYPFKSGIVLPFPDSLISALSIGIQEDNIDNPVAHRIRISAINILDGIVEATVCLIGDNATDSEELLGFLNTSTGQLNVSSRNWSGFIQAGEAADLKDANYVGPFELSPSCIFPVPKKALCRYDSITVNGVTYPGKKQLVVNTAGLFSTTGNFAFELADSRAPEDMLNIVDAGTYSRVTSINGYKASTLSIQTSDTTVVSITSTDIPKNLIDVKVKGTTAFPNCYTSSYVSDYYKNTDVDQAEDY